MADTGTRGELWTHKFLHFLVFCVKDVAFHSPVFGGWKYVESGCICPGSLVKEVIFKSELFDYQMKTP
jgi:hypothetical protein